ncbi:MAG: glycerol-3-phosphate dehydrogenase [Alphaproteobacteria bacterium]
MAATAWKRRSQMQESDTYDLVVVGGGINGTSIARDAAGRGLSVALVEKGDLAAATSSASSKLIHGGLRYLERYHFRLVRECLAEREVMLRAAPHLVWPMRFVLPLRDHLRSSALIRAGLFLYDHLGGPSRLPHSRRVHLDQDPVGEPLRPGLARGAIYSDCWGDDARLVVSYAIDAAARGARILTRSMCLGARRRPDATGRDGWDVEVLDGATAHTVSLRCRALVNTGGPWAREIHGMAVNGGGESPAIRLVKGSHIVVPRLYEGDHAYVLQNDDQRVVFVLPFEGAFSLIGTTDVPFVGRPAAVAVDPEEIDYLCVAVNRYFRSAISRESVVWAFAGVRPLVDDGATDVSAITRDYVLVTDGGGERAPLVSVLGGKITTSRRLAEVVLDRLANDLPKAGPAWTATATLPGGDFGLDGLDGCLREGRLRWPWLPAMTLRRYVRAYGTRAETLIGAATSLTEMGEDLGGRLYEAEVAYLTGHEFARTADDILWRRSKLGLHLGSSAHETLTAALSSRGPGRAPWENDVHPVHLPIHQRSAMSPLGMAP